MRLIKSQSLMSDTLLAKVSCAAGRKHRWGTEKKLLKRNCSPTGLQMADFFEKRDLG
jgi:hypothetical protein